MGKKEKGKADKQSSDKDKSSDARLRIAIVNEDRCKPKKCRQECKRSCPVVSTGKQCIEVDVNSKKAWISETLCIGCGICVKKCPFEAIQIINIPKEIGKETTHRFGPNTFKLHRLPTPRPGKILGLVGTNGIGKSTALKILAGKLKPNLGRYDDPPGWAEILSYFRGSELQNYLKRVYENDMTAMIKPQYVDRLPQKVKGTLGDIIKGADTANMADEVLKELDLSHLLTRNIEDLSGGELQRFAIALVMVRNAGVSMYDEPSSYLDVSQRVKAAKAIRSKVRSDNYIIVVEHDLSILDFLSDFVCCLWGRPSIFGVVTTPFGVREGINIFLDGFVTTENLRFREESLTFKLAVDADLLDEVKKRLHFYEYPLLSKQLGKFMLTVHSGSYSESEIIVMLGENGTGKTTLIKMLAGLLKADNAEEDSVVKQSVSYKPQTINPKFQGTVRQLMLQKVSEAFAQPLFQTDVLKPLQLDDLYDQEVKFLSGGELQRVALAVTLGKPADIYLIDEPSAYLDSEQRIIASKVIKRFILHAKKTAFVVEHDFIMATYLADRVIVFEGNPGVECVARQPEKLVSGMNRFLKKLEITFRRDPTNFRPRINKMNSVKDREQKQAGLYFLLEE